MSSVENCVQKDVLVQMESIKLIESQSKEETTSSIGRKLSGEEIKETDIDEDSVLKIYETNDDNQENQTDDKFYENAKKYWSNIPPTIDGMLGGFSEISTIDLKGSNQFLNMIFKMKSTSSPPGKRYALDCGAGIGRITKGLLLKIFDKVDIVEQDRQFSQKAIEYIGKENSNRIGKIYNLGLQEFVPESMKYDIVWCQWVLGHLTDNDLMNFFQRIKLGLNRNGLLIIKENITSSNSLELDDVDSSMTRPLKTYQDLIKKSGFRIIKSTKQTNFPKGLYPVHIMACR